jgi:hypothetical protein
MSLLDALPLLAVSSALCVFCLLLYHVVYIIASIAVSVIIRKNTESGRELETFARRGLIGRFVGLVVLVITSVGRLLVQLTATIGTVLYYLLPIVVISAILALMQFRWGSSMHALDTIVKGDMPIIRAIILAPFALAAETGLYIAPIYNLVVYTLVHAPLDFLLWILSGAGGAQFAGGLLSILLACRDAAVALASFLEANPSECTSAFVAALGNCTSTADGVGTRCTGPTSPAYASAAFTCLDPGLRGIDLSSSSATARNGMESIVRALGGSDATLGLVLNMVAYPITDGNTWAAIESLANAVLGAVVSMPTSTVARCGLAFKQDPVSLRLAMCTPDFAPPMDALVSACRSVGMAINGWLNMLYVLIVYGDHTPCPSSMDVSAVFSDPVWNRIVGSNQTVLVRMTDTTFARTDGSSIEYISTASQVHLYSICNLAFGRFFDNTILRSGLVAGY